MHSAQLVLQYAKKLQKKCNAQLQEIKQTNSSTNLQAEDS